MSNTNELPFPSGGQAHRGEGGQPSHGPVGDHAVHHGRPRSWVLVGVVIAAFIGGGVAIIAHLWELFWACASLVVLSVPVGKLIGIMEDTVEVQGWRHEVFPAREPGSAADPGVRVK